MTLEVELILPPDVEIVSVHDLAPNIRTKLDAPGDDYALTRLRSRAPSRIIDKDSAALLELFRSPTRIVDAILSFAGQRGLDPELTLDQAYPLLFRLWEAELLVPANSSASNVIESKLRVGEVVGGFRLLRCVQVLEDTEVFLGRDPASVYAAVKFCRQGKDSTVRALEHEAGIMRRVQGRRAPTVFSLTRFNEGIALISEWVFGLDATNSAAGMRGRREPRNEKRLLSLCIEVAQAFAEVHATGVLHGDVHPRNVLVEPGGSVRLIDYGLSQDVERTGEHTARGGIAFYFDPELAEAQLDHTYAPLTAAGEQYSVASLLYQLWTGAHYVDWRLERNEMLRQIVEEESVTFEARSIPPWPDLEQILRRALHKRPERRFESMLAFAQALRKLLPEAEARDRLTNVQRREQAREENLLERSLRRYDLGGSGLLEGLANAPFASINYGAGGIAYAIYRIAQRRGNAHLLALADIWIQRAYAISSHEQAFYNSELGIERGIVGEVSLFHSKSGLHCVRGLISIAYGDIDGAARALSAFVSHSRRPCENPDLTLGTASLLIGLAELIEALPRTGLIDLEPARRRGEEIASELVQLLNSDSIATSTNIPSLGVAHGWSGFLFALLRWAKATSTNPESIVTEKLSELASLAEPHGGGVRWPVYNATKAPSFMDSWCNGTAGHVLLFALAYNVLRIDSFVELVERAAESAWATEAGLGTLCCGLAGIGYAFLAAYRVTGSELWLERACAVTRRAAADSSRHFFRDSLYKGAVGVAVLTEDLKQPIAAAMPLFEPTS